MKKLLLFTFCLALASMQLQAQFVIVNSPESLEGGYDFDAAGFGRALDSVWTEDVAFIDDGSAIGTEGCTEALNPADLAGKIALIDRGSCEFGVKCLNAETAGAVAAVVFNHTAGAGTIAMGPGANGGNVTIPCVMLSFEDGQAIRAAMDAGMTVNMTIGDVRFPNNVGSSNTAVIAAPQGTMALSQLDAASIVSPGALVTNRGTNDATGITVTATINHTADGSTNQVYQETGMSAETLMTDSSDFVVLPVYDPAPEGAGTYDVSYEISSDNPDDVINDNVVSNTFNVVEFAVSKAGWDFDNDRPQANASFTINGGGAIEFITPFHFPKGFGYQLDAVSAFVSSSTPATLAGETIEVFAYEWTDTSEDGIINNDEIEVLALGLHEFDAAETETSAWISVPLLAFPDLDDPSYIIPEDDKNYLVGVRYSGENTVFFGFDNNHDLTEYVNFVTENGTYTDMDLPYIGINAWNDLLPDVDAGFLFTDLRSVGAAGLRFSLVPVDGNKNILEEEVAISLYPNPVSDQLVSQITLEEQAKTVEYQILDINGRVLFTAQQENVTTQQKTFDVSRLSAGQYIFSVQLKEGSKSLPFMIQR